MKSNKESINYALKSLEISTKSYIDFLNSPNLKNASEMIIASNLAGKAINISKTTCLMQLLIHSRIYLILVMEKQ